VKKLLLVEGARPIEGLSGSLFNRRECVLEVASSATEAIAMAVESRPDLVLLDSAVADVELDQLVAGLAAACGRKVPVFLVLAEGAEHEVADAMCSGVSCAIVRPLDEIELNVRICELLGITLRRHLRTFVKMKVDATVGTSTHFATISNISLSGVLIETEKPIHLGDIIKLSFFLPEDEVPITVISKVVREAPGTGHAYGCQFLDLPDSGRARINEFVSREEAVV
jgi:CheY-like chemotaxis protein